jgi:ornithine decarboxylase
MKTFPSAREAALALRPDTPLYCFRRDVLTADTQAFMQAFPGKTAYAVKTNSDPAVLATVSAAGVTAFDVASPAEFAGAREAQPGAELLYMHPVKAQSDIRLAVESYGIRVMAVDHEDEVAKILRIVHALDLDPADFTLFVRIATKGHAAYELSRKFGATPRHAVELLDRIDNIGFRSGIAFHVGSQVEDLDTYERALASAAWIRGRTRAELSALDIGGGFPAQYGPDRQRSAARVPQVGELLADVLQEVREWGLDDLPLVAEPGRVVVARSLSVVVRVLLRKGQRLYINDGIWSSLSDAWTGKISLPVQHIEDPSRRRPARAGGLKFESFRICGATCDSVDILTRPFWLPDTVSTGDWIEVGHIGAYSLSLRTRFNGFYPDTFVAVTEPFDIDSAIIVPPTEPARTVG